MENKKIDKSAVAESLIEVGTELVKYLNQEKDWTKDKSETEQVAYILTLFVSGMVDLLDIKEAMEVVVQKQREVIQESKTRGEA